MIFMWPIVISLPKARKPWQRFLTGGEDVLLGTCFHSVILIEQPHNTTSMLELHHNQAQKRKKSDERKKQMLILADRQELRRPATVH
jgi:hypothetical protein